MLKYNKEKIEDIFKEHNIVFAYIFGSQAHDKAGPISDIDIAVYFDDSLVKQERFDLKLRLMARLSDLFEKEDVDIVSLNDAYPLLAHRILKHGKLIYAKSMKQEKDYEDRAIGEYLDWQPYLEEQVKNYFKLF